uniref:Solute carrier family 12 member 9 n=2 Tax=Meloidogyne incognita group TaxID=654580 RepID=A0A915LH89_MELJA
MIVEDERRTQISAANLRIPPYGILEEQPTSPDAYHASNALNLESVGNNSVIIERNKANNTNNCVQSTGIILLTVLSLCAVSSNGAVEGGGVYYMISRTLGPEFGGSVGLLFFMANVFSCALYIAGFTEALTNVTGIGDMFGGKFIHCVFVSIIILMLCLLGSDWFARTALLALFLIVLAFCSFLFTIFVRSPSDIRIPFDNTYAYMVPKNATDPASELIVQLNQTITAQYTSFSVSTFTENLMSNFTIDYTTGHKTGLMAGANMSGELARPNVSIPRGTLQAVFTTLFTYVFTTFLLCLSCSRKLLQQDYMVMVDISVVPSILMLGIFAATFFSSMSNLIGASRVLTRFAQDKLFGNLLKPATLEFGSKRNPLISVIISWVGVVFVLMIGAMNRIAKITSILFLLSYMGVNIATLALELTSAPNFRPNFKYFSWHTCALGALSTVIMMLVIDTSISAAAVVMLMLLIMILHYQAPIGQWGSISQALIYHQVRKYLLLLDIRKEHVKFWRPQILLLVNRPATCFSLMDFVNDIKKSGLYVIGHVQRGDMGGCKLSNGGGDLSKQSQQTMDPLQQVFPYWLSLVDYLKLKAFVELTLTDDVRIGIQQLTRLSGLGAMKPNTVILGFHEEKPCEPILSETHLLKELKFSKIGRTEVVEYFTASDFPPNFNSLEGNDISSANSTTRLEALEYVQILNDIINLNKNVCVARHFTQFDKEISLKQSSRRFIDVWPSHFFKIAEEGKGNKTPGTGLRWDNSSLFVLQLACILSMSSKWKNTTLRVHICVHSLQDMHCQELQLKSMLEQLRIKAKTVMVPWDHVLQQIEKTTSQTFTEITEYPLQFVKAVNETIQRNSGEGAAVCFLNLPNPPLNANKSEYYLQQLSILTDSLPPTILVHGLTSVISTAL